MRKLAHALALAALLVSQTFFAQNTDTCQLKIGTNLGIPTHRGSEFPFANLMKYGRTWMAHNNANVPGGLNLWDTGFQKYLQYDADGYPLELPAQGIPGAEAPQVVRTVWENTAALPGGTYTVQWDGEGLLDVWGDVANKTVLQGKISFVLTPGVQNLLALEINKSLASDHVRNIRVLFPNTDLTFQMQPFNQSWLDKLEPFGTFRFMDFGLTNENETQKWSQRTRLNDYTYTAKTGVPYEWMIYLCNLKKADAWVCIPHRATDDYITQLATLFRSQLAPGQKVYVEYSNEMWDLGQSQGRFGQDSLAQNIAWPERLAPRIAHVMGIWTNVFGTQNADRIVRVMGANNGVLDFANRVFSKLEADGKAHLVDAIGTSAQLIILPNLLDQFSTGQDVINIARHISFDPTFPTMQGWSGHANFAKNKGKRLLYYNGGQNFVPQPFGTIQPYCQAILDAQTAPGIYDIYRDLFDTLRSTAPAQKLLFMHSGLIAPKNCQFGTSGALENQFAQQPPFAATAPKYQALLDEMQDCSNNNPCPWTTAAIAGVTQVCLGYTAIYKTVQTAGSYFWSVTGGTIQSGQGTNQIQVIWNSNAQPLNGGVGLKLTTGNCTASGSLTISQATTPAPWTNIDIGSPTKKGDICYDQPTGTMTVRGGGADIYGTTDRFHFVEQTFAGDFTLVARVSQVQNTSLYAKAGIMVREANTASAKNVMVGAMPNKQVFMQRRTASGGSTVRKTISYQAVPKYLKITREANIFKGWRSNDGTNWALIQTATVAMANEVFVGLAVTSKNNVATCTGVFDKISLTAGVSVNDITDDRADFSEDEMAEKTDFEVFPNPVGRELTILFSSKNETTARLILSEMTGRNVFSTEMDLLDGDNELPVSLPVLPSGVYLLTLRTGNEVRVKRVLVE